MYMCACACVSRGMRVCCSAVENEPCTNSGAQRLQGFIWTCSCAYAPARPLTLSCSLGAVVDRGKGRGGTLKSVELLLFVTAEI